MSTYYIYRMTCDTGNAPCVTDINGNKTGLLTLACCKGGQIRRYKSGKVTEVRTGLRKTIGGHFIKNRESDACDDIFVIGIMKDRVLYVAKITEVLTMSEYFSIYEYRNRKDCIYDVVSKNADYLLKRRDGFNAYFHGNAVKDAEKQHICDRLGTYVLLSDEFSYYGIARKDIPFSMSECLPKGRESKILTEMDKCYGQTKDFVSKCLGERFVSDKPTSELGANNCKSKGCQK